MNIRIADATEEHLLLLLEMINEFYFLEHLHYDDITLQKCIRELMANKEYGIIRLVFEETQAIGYFILTFGYSLEFHGRDALLDEFYIRENFRGQGAGTQCLSFIEDLCIRENIKAIHLEVDHINHLAKELYHRNGYKDHNRYLLTKWIVK